MGIKKSHILDDIVFCSGCKQRIQPIVVAYSISDFEISRDKEKEDFASENYESIGHSIVKENVLLFDKITFFIRCPVSSCKKEYLYIKKEPKKSELKDSIIFEPELIPQSCDWHLFPLSNPSENNTMVIPAKPYSLYLDAIKCYNLKLNVACGFLVGAVIESVCIVEKIKPITIENKKKRQIERGKFEEGKKIIVKLSEMLPDLVKEKSLTSEFTILLQTLSKVRNESAHPDEIEEGLNEKELLISIRSIENVLEELYLDPYRKRMRKKSAEQSSNYIRDRLNTRRSNGN